MFSLPYRYVFAIATEDSVFLYDTQSIVPFAFVTGIHYSNLSDLCWSSDGRLLITTSIDGFSTFLIFGANELGTLYTAPAVQESASVCSSQASQASSTLTGSQQQLLLKAN
jgi:chromatin assembly factor 1 subunit B